MPSETSRRKWVEKRKNDGRARRYVLVAIGALLVVAVTGFFSVRIMSALKQASHYTTMDMRQLQLSFYIYSFKSRITGGPAYPPKLEDLVKKGNLSQADYDRITRSYNIEYTQPPAGASPDTIVFRAQRKPVATIYTVSGQSRIEAIAQ